jgi:hypothetical protein
MTNTISITIAMISATLLVLVAIPLQALALVSAGGTVGTGEQPEISLPKLPSVPELPEIAEPEIPDIAEPKLPATPELSDILVPEL